MLAKDLYSKLDHDFDLVNLKDDWARMLFDEFITENFRARYMGLVVDHAQTIEHVFSAVFPSDPVLSKILDSGRSNALLFVHHPSTWDIRPAPKCFTNMNRSLLSRLRDRNVSIYNLHVPLDKNGPFSTSMTLARALSISPTGEFAEYFGVNVGILGKTQHLTCQSFADDAASVLGHRVQLYNYGDPSIHDGRVGLIGGGGFDVPYVKQLSRMGINTLLTGITAKIPFTQPAHELAQHEKINIIGATHYSTEKFACIEMCRYFRALGLTAEFIDDEPVLEDM
jgi:putative NIF3 family GTP cyclohydrolase 1 type 2